MLPRLIYTNHSLHPFPAALAAIFFGNNKNFTLLITADKVYHSNIDFMKNCFRKYRTSQLSAGPYRS
jgi:hypothetical protein